MSTQSDTLINLLAGTARGWRGTRAKARSTDNAPKKPLKLYDIEACPYCRLVREVLTELDLDVVILPCPKNGTRFRLEAEKLGGKQQFPLLHDENTGKVLYESAQIIAYLKTQYGRRPKTAVQGLKKKLAEGSSFVSSALLWRPGGMTGLNAAPSRKPEKMLELFSFETSPFSKPVRARLCELEIPYLLRNTGKGGWSDMGPPSFRDNIFKGPRGTTHNRQWLDENTGKVQVPYLIDENTDTAMYESARILRYLNAHYALQR